MEKMQMTTRICPGSPADRRILINGLTLIALGLSVLFLNSWDSLFVRASVGLFWGAFFLISNWSDLVHESTKSQSLKWITPPQHRMILSPTAAHPASSPSIICQ